MSIKTLRRRLRKHGYIVRSRGGFYCVVDASTNAYAHDRGADGHPLDLEGVAYLAGYLCG
jgi:hypothetical protein